MKFLYTLLLFTFSICACAQKMPEYGVNRVRITDTNKTIVAEVLPVNSPPHAQSNLRYYWYASGKIQSLQGSFSGHLLNGAYHEFYLNKNLCAQGAYYQGLKDGTWKTWNEDGTLKSSINWKKGVQSGKFSFFNPDGGLQQSGRYAKDKMDGPVIFYEGKDSVRTTYYKNGQALKAKPRSFLDKVNIFKKKPKTSKPNA